MASIGSSCQTNRPVAAKLFEIDGQASANSTSVSRSTTLLASSCSITVPSAIRISENDAIRSGLGCRARASVSTWPDQFERPPGAKLTVMVGRTSVTSAIWILPVSNGKKRRRTTSCCAVRAEAPVRLSPRLTSLKLTLPVGKSETATSPRNNGSNPVTARIWDLTESRTVSAEIRNDKASRKANPATTMPATANPKRLMPVAADNEASFRIRR